MTKKIVEPTGNSANHERLIDAVERCFDRFGIDKTSMEDVAMEAGVSRQTVYRLVGNRSDLLRAVVLRIIGRHWRGVADHGAGCASLSEWLTEAIIFCLHEIPHERQHNLIKRLNAYEDGMKVALSDEGLQPAILAMQRHFNRALKQGHLKPGITPAATVEWIYRLIHSYVLIPSSHHNTEKSFRHWLSTVPIAGLFRVPNR